MLDRIKLEDYQNEPNGARKDFWRDNIKEYFKQAPEGQKTSLKEANNEIDKVVNNTYYGYKGELMVLNYLKEHYPSSNWHFVSPDAGYFVLGPTQNEPDLTNDLVTLEVKSYTIYSDTVYIKCKYKQLDDLWAKKFHSADILAIIDQSRKAIAFVSRHYFNTHVICYWNSYIKKWTWELQLDKIDFIGE